MQIKLIWHSKDYTYSVLHQWNDNIRIVPVTTSSRNNRVGRLTVLRTSANDLICSTHWNVILVWALKDVNGPTKSRVLARCTNSLGTIKNRINTRFLSNDLTVKRYWDNMVPIKACLLSHHIHQIRLIY